MKPLTLFEVERAVGGRINDKGFYDIKVRNVSTDTRFEMEAGLFIPLIGAVYDGHDFIRAAYANGALCCLSQSETVSDKPVIYVDDTKAALKKLAAYYRSLFNVTVVAITGSSGKTTTKDLVASVLSQGYRTVKTEGNLNNEIGLPLTIFGIDERTQALVLEMGMNHFGEIRALSEIARPNVCIITNIGVAHIENLGSMEGILRAKSEIFDFMHEDGAIILNGDDNMLATLKKTGREVYYGTGRGNDVFCSNIEYNGLHGISFWLHSPRGICKISVPSPGAHMVSNALCAAAVGEVLGLTPKQIQTGAAQFKTMSMRMKIGKTADNVTVIDDAYNANPHSMRAALDVLRQAEGKKVCILGDMLELGDFSESMHFDVGLYAAEAGIDSIICIGEKSMSMFEGAKKADRNGEVLYFAAKEEFLEQAANCVKAGDTVLVKASRGMSFEEITAALSRRQGGTAVS